MTHFSKEAIKKEVLRTSLESPMTLFATGIGILAGLASFLFDGGFLLNLVAMAGIGLGVASWFVNFFFRKEILTNEYFKKLEQEFKKRNDEMLAAIKRGLGKENFGRDISDFAEQGLDQFIRIQEKFKVLNEILDKKFNAGELTYRRFLGTAEQVYLSVLDNLDAVTTMLNSSSAIDLDYVEDRLDYFESKSDKNEDDVKEMESLLERKKIKENQILKINKLLSVNEQAMTKLDATSTSIATVKTKQGKASQDIEMTIQQLEQLAESAKKYEVH